MDIKRGFQDVRSKAQLLADERQPKALKFIKKNPLSAKLRAIVSKVAGVSSGVAGSVIGKYALRGAAKITAALSGAKLLNVLSGAAKPVSSIQKAASSFSVGVSVIEELDPTKLVRPLIDGPSINPAQAAKQLSKTAASGILTGMISSVPLARGTTPAITVFKSLTKIKSSPRFFDSRKATAASTTTSPTTLANTTISLIQQRGLLEDEIMYRLVLLAENVYEPIFKYSVSVGYGAPTILEGFRSENTGTSQHERGEAMDITLPSKQNLYNLAIWIRDNVAYDQLILCHSGITGGHSWIHISFTPDSRRRQVLTKCFNDTFEPGLHLYDVYTDNAILAADKAKALQQDKLASDMMQRLAARDAKLNPVAVNTEEQTKDATSVGGGSASTGPDGRTGTPTPKPVYVGHPGGTCTLAAMPEHDDGGFEETASFQEQVEEAQAEVFLNYGSDPAWFNTDGSVVSIDQYVQEVARVLRTYGFCAEQGGPPDEVAVKVTNEWNDQYDIVIGGTNMPWCGYQVTLRPARF